MSDDNLTLEQKATNYETMRHIHTVQRFLSEFVVDLLRRADAHDQSKLVSPEVEAFTEYTPKLATTTYGSEEYECVRKALGPALAHHYAKNRHHPEHFPDGVNGMTLMDLVEMFCDWKAATMRHNDGNLLKSIELNTERFGLSPQLRKILENTAEALD
jgi:Family of unknown function (DUF5662)